MEKSMRKPWAPLLLIVSCLSLPFAVSAGVTGTHGPDRSSGAVVAKPKPASSEQNAEQATKPEEKKETETGKEAK
jgi:hypothetical protein